MNFLIVSKRQDTVRSIDLARPKTLFLLGAGAFALVAIVFVAGLQLGRFITGPLKSAELSQAIEQQRIDLADARGQLQGTVDALTKRVSTLNAQLIRLDALGRRITDLANLERGEFDFDQAPPQGGPGGTEFASGSMAVPELTAVLDTLEAQLEDRERQLTVLERLMSTQQLGERIFPGGLPLIGGWISSHFGFRVDPFTGLGAFHRGVDFAGKPGTKVIATGAGTISFSGYKSGYGNVVEITHPTGYVTRYGHNSRNLVKRGQTVQKGQSIAIIGSTGRSTGTHVHFEVEKNGKVVNPRRYLEAG
jgi:murein DD-endopeptidase MepM/ murein hydrolase activator NlpD